MNHSINISTRRHFAQALVLATIATGVGGYAFNASASAPLAATAATTTIPSMGDDVSSSARADFNGDGRDDIAAMYNYGSANTGVWLFNGTPTGFNQPTRVFSSGTGGWDYDRTKLTAGDYNGDGKADLAAFYDYGNSRTGINVFRGTTTGLAMWTQPWVSPTNTWTWANTKLASGNNLPPVIVTPPPAAPGPRLPVPRNTTTLAKLTKPHHDYPSADIPVPTGTPAYAVQGGTVTKVGAMGGCGNGVIINNGNLVWTYCHGNGVMRVKAGQTIAAGTEIMQTGNTGNSSGPHLHIQVKLNNQLRCPQPALAAAWNGTAYDFQKMPASGCSY